MYTILTIMNGEFGDGMIVANVVQVSGKTPLKRNEKSEKEKGGVCSRI